MSQRKITAPPTGLAAWIPFNILIPSSLFCAAAICYYDPQKFPTLFFALGAFGYLVADPLIRSSHETVVRHIADGFTKSLVDFSSNESRAEEFMTALSDAIRLAVTNDQLKTTLGEVIGESLRDGDLQSECLTTLSGAIVRASDDDNLRKVLLSAVQNGFSEALNDKKFMEGLFSSLVKAIVSAATNSELRQVCLEVTTQAVSDAVRDERFMFELREAIKGCLSDSDIFRAGAVGFFGAVRGKKAKEPSQEAQKKEPEKDSERPSKSILR